MSKRFLALVAATFVSIIYGLTFTIAKDVMPAYILPFGFIVLRVGGSVVLFWIIWLFLPKEKIDRKDFPRIIAAAFFGIAFNMLTFFKGLSLTSPISAAVLMVSTPIIVLILSAIIMKERMLKRKVFGIVLGLVGTAFLILYGKSVGNVESTFNERIKTNNRCCFYLSPTSFCHNFRHRFRKRRIEFSQNWRCNSYLFGCVFSNSKEEVTAY